MFKKPDKYHNESDSQFFRMASKRKLASILFVSIEKLKSFDGGKDFYFSFQKQKKSGGYREINAPRDDLKSIQSRIANLLSRIAPPDFLFAPVAGRSYVDNAARHVGAKSIHLLDIEDFFPSCTANKVFWLFNKRLQCEPDIAYLLKNIVTLDGVLPQGSPCSPILAYLCYVDMWSEINSIVSKFGCRLSVYADDLTVSGEAVPPSMVWEIKKILKKHGHKHKPSKERSKYLRPAEITGVIISQNRLHAPNRQHKKMYDVRCALSAAKDAEQKSKFLAQFNGRQAQMKQITSLN